ncbi:MAG: hypothetical protein H6707_19205 [Deltaproteobacteria bacterium]|nr:hypothetical protein [Deltaproteobacteria bacterium]
MYATAEVERLRTPPVVFEASVARAVPTSPAQIDGAAAAECPRRGYFDRLIALRRLARLERHPLWDSIVANVHRSHVGAAQQFAESYRLRHGATLGAAYRKLLRLALEEPALAVAWRPTLRSLIRLLGGFNSAEMLYAIEA